MSDRLTPKQEAFVAEYIANGGNATAAYKAAYHPKDDNSAAASAARMLRNAKIIKKIKAIQDEEAETRIVSMTQVRAFWSDVIQDDSHKLADRLKASELFAKSAGAFLHLRPSADDPGIYFAGEDSEAGDVVIYLPQIDREEDHQVNDTEGDEVIKTELSEDWKT